MSESYMSGARDEGAMGAAGGGAGARADGRGGSAASAPAGSLAGLHGAGGRGGASDAGRGRGGASEFGTGRAGGEGGSGRGGAHEGGAGRAGAFDGGGGRGGASDAGHGSSGTTHGRAEAADGTGTEAKSEWYTGIADENIRRWAQGKGWKDPLAAVESNYNLERLIGLDRAGRTLVLPREDAAPEELQAFRSRLGVPESPEGYQLPVPEGAPEDFAHTAAQWMHEAGVPAKSAEQLVTRWNAHLDAAQRAGEQHHQVESAAQLDALKGEWGSNFEVNAEHARRAALHFLPAPEGTERLRMMAQVERAMGTGNFMRFMAKVGRGLGEHQMVQSGESGGHGALAPGEARARIAELRADRAWTASYIAGDAGKAAEMNRLHRMAFPSE